MQRHHTVKRVLTAASAIGALLFVGIFVWMYAIGYLPVELLVLFVVANLVVCYYSIREFSKLSQQQ